MSRVVVAWSLEDLGIVFVAQESNSRNDMHIYYTGFWSRYAVPLSCRIFLNMSVKCSRRQFGFVRSEPNEEATNYAVLPKRRTMQLRH